MINHSTMKHLMEDLLCAGILLSLCAVIILGPQPKFGELNTSASAQPTGVSVVQSAQRSVSSDTVLQTSTKSPNQ